MQFAVKMLVIVLPWFTYVYRQQLVSEAQVVSGCVQRVMLKDSQTPSSTFLMLIIQPARLRRSLCYQHTFSALPAYRVCFIGIAVFMQAHSWSINLSSF